ncbi:MAG: metallophosphoesterase family protein [Chloroflexi bacterium]|nr:metallophosphoesterase family protein [Chloroflexota bacterium]
MRIAIVADIHSNIVAFEAVLAALRQQGGFDRLWCLGDTVGYGPRPNECVELLRSLDHVGAAGNHDWASVGRASLTLFNPEAAACCRWSGAQLTPENRRYLEALEPVVRVDDFTLVHGSLRDPIWEYLVHEEAAQASFERLATRYLLVGHSHLPLLFQEADAGGVLFESLQEDRPLRLGPARFILNPGGVGQPRDGDPRAAYALYDTEAGLIHYRRVPYDIPRVQGEMRRLDLPPRMAERLALGW